MSNELIVRNQQRDEWEQLVPMWIHGRPASTVNVYLPEIRTFRKWLGEQVQISQITLGNLQKWCDYLVKDHKPRTVQRMLSTIRSLLTFCHEIGFIQFNPGAALRGPKVPSDLADKIMTLAQVKRMIGKEPDRQHKVMMTVMYVTGIRAAECSGLTWRDVRARRTNGQITVLGKGAKTRSIRLGEDAWKMLSDYRPKKANLDAPVFPRDNGRPMARTYVTEVVRRAAKRANIPAAVSSHWLRHAHATHSMDAGAPLALISATLGHTSLDTTSRYLHVNPQDSSSRFISI